MADDKTPPAGAPGADAAANPSNPTAGASGADASQDAPKGAPKAKPVKMLRIISKREGFRRCGVAHPEAATLHRIDRFTKEERAALEAERWLVVDEVLVDPVTKEVL